MKKEKKENNHPLVIGNKVMDGIFDFTTDAVKDIRHLCNEIIDLVKVPSSQAAHWYDYGDPLYDMNLINEWVDIVSESIKERLAILENERQIARNQFKGPILPTMPILQLCLPDVTQEEIDYWIEKHMAEHYKQRQSITPSD